MQVFEGIQPFVLKRSELIRRSIKVREDEINEVQFVIEQAVMLVFELSVIEYVLRKSKADSISFLLKLGRQHAPHDGRHHRPPHHRTKATSAGCSKGLYTTG